MKILALDIATCTGWAVGPVISGPTKPAMFHTEADAAKVYSGENDLGGKGYSEPAIFLEHHKFIDGLINLHEVDFVYIEAPFVGQVSAAMRLLGLVAITEMTAAKNGIWPSRIHRVHIGTIKKHWSGYGMASKDSMIKAAESRGYRPEGDNEADALALLDYAMCEVEPPRRRRSPPIVASAKGRIPNSGDEHGS